MDRITFIHTVEKYEWGEFDCASIVVNGMSLIELLREYEMPFAKAEGAEHRAGDYINIVRESLHNMLLNPTPPVVGDPKKIELLTCSCGSPGCWPMLVKIMETENSVIWSDFEQPHRKETWDYTKFGPFEFEKEQYYQAIETLHEIPVNVN